MEEILKEARLAKAELDEGELALINAQTLRPLAADAALSELLAVPVGSPLLFMDEVDYDIDGRPVFCSQEYFVDGLVRHTVLRKKL